MTSWGRSSGRPSPVEAWMSAAIFVAIGLACLFLAAVGVTARQVSLALLGAFFLALGFCWPILVHGFGG